MTLSNKQLVAFKIGARARKLLKEDCVIEGYELLLTAIKEVQESDDNELYDLLQTELTKYENLVDTWES